MKESDPSAPGMVHDRDNDRTLEWSTGSKARPASAGFGLP
jgi:hypothetical protein